MRVITIKKPPSADTASRLLGEWTLFERRGGWIMLDSDGPVVDGLKTWEW